jgi:hypothetical protein
MTRIEVGSLRTHHHRFVPHPFSVPVPATDEARVRQAIDRLRTGERVDTEVFAREVAPFLEPRLGVLGEVGEGNLPQIPLAVARVEVSDPVGLLGPGARRPVVTGAGPSQAEARLSAAVRGLATYVSLMVDPRRLHTRPGTPDPRTGDPDADLAALRAGRYDGYLWGHGLADGAIQDVPATAVFPALRPTPDAYGPPPGVAGGYDWAEAVRAGLLGQCRRLTLDEIVQSDYRGTAINWQDAPVDPRGDRLRSMVEILDVSLEVHDVTGSVRVPTLAFLVDGTTVAYTSGFSFADALRDGFAEVLRWTQLQAYGEAGAAVPPLPGRETGGRGVDCPDWSTDQATTVARLADRGRHPVAVPLDHDPEVTDRVLPYLVHIVLTHG